MAIKLSNPETVPSFQADGLHIDSLLIRVDRETAKRKINANASTYGFDSEGTKIFRKDLTPVKDDDFNSTALAYAIAQGQATDLSDALTQFAAAKAAAVTANYTIIELMAIFEVGVGRIFEVEGVATIAGIE